MSYPDSCVATEDGRGCICTSGFPTRIICHNTSVVYQQDHDLWKFIWAPTDESPLFGFLLALVVVASCVTLIYFTRQILEWSRECRARRASTHAIHQQANVEENNLLIV